MRIQGGDTPLFNGRVPQILATVTGTLGAVSDGMHYGWTAPVLPILRNATTTPVQITEADEHWLENIYMIGGICGLPITIYCVDKFGRKPTILLSAVQHIIAWILIASAYSVEFFYVARFLGGIAGDVAFVSAPMYIGEIADHEIRGFLSGMIYLMMLFGFVILYAVAPFVSLAVSSLVAASFVTVQLITFSLMPESPYYLILKGKQAQALTSLQKLRSKKDVSRELTEISAAVERQNSERGRPIDLFTIASNRKALIIMLVLNASQQFGSITVILMNLHTILGDASSILPASTAGIVFSVIMLIAATAATLLVDKAGRKSLLRNSSVLSGACLLALAIYFSFKNSGFDITSVNWIPVVAVMIYAAVFKYGLGLVPIVMTAELFPTSVKAMGMTVADASVVLFGLLSLIIYEALHNFGMHWPFYVFAASCFLTGVFTAFYIPETKGKTLEQIQEILKGTHHVSKYDNQAENSKNNQNSI